MAVAAEPQLDAAQQCTALTDGLQRTTYY